MGLAFQAPSLAVQTVLPKKDVPIGSSLMFFSQLLGASVIVSVGENVLDNQLVQRLSGIPGFNRSFVTSGGATSLIDSLPADLRETVLIAYNESLRKVFQIGFDLSMPFNARFSFPWSGEACSRSRRRVRTQRKAEPPTEEKIGADDGAELDSGLATKEKDIEITRPVEATEKEAAVK